MYSCEYIELIDETERVVEEQEIERESDASSCSLSNHLKLPKAD